MFVHARRPSLLLAVLLLAAALLTACSNPVSAIKGSSPSKPKPPPVWSMSGLPRTGPVSRPILIAKMDNTESSRPQIGVNKADLVVQELVEGGLTRLALFYQSQLPPVVGPIRSMRATDIGVVRPTNGTIITSGAATPTLALVRKAHVNFIQDLDGTTTAADEGFVRDPNRFPPYNLFMHTAKLVPHLKRSSTALPYLPWGPTAKYDAMAKKKAHSLTAMFSPSTSITWTYGGGRYHDSNSNAQKPFPATTILVLRVREKDAGYLDPAGNHVPATVLTGTGDATLFHGGRMLTCQWTKANAKSPLRLQLKGKAVTVPAGHTWIELLPRNSDGGKLTSTR